MKLFSFPHILFSVIQSITSGKVNSTTTQFTSSKTPAFDSFLQGCQREYEKWPELKLLTYLIVMKVFAHKNTKQSHKDCFNIYDSVLLRSEEHTTELLSRG